jgi:hypothetical protein
MGHPVTALTKTLLDQLLMAPAGIAVFFTAMGVLEGATPAQVRVRCACACRTHLSMRGWACMLKQAPGRPPRLPTHNTCTHARTTCTHQAWATAKEKFRPTLMANYLLWPAANL